MLLTLTHAYVPNTSYAHTSSIEQLLFDSRLIQSFPRNPLYLICFYLIGCFFALQQTVEDWLESSFRTEYVHLI